MVTGRRQRRVEQRGDRHRDHILFSESVVPPVDDRVVGLAGIRTNTQEFGQAEGGGRGGKGLASERFRRTLLL